MGRFRCVLFVLLFMFGLAVGADAQQDPTRLCGTGTSEFLLEQNRPNPFTAGTVTRIPFTLCQPLFAEGRPVVVSLQVLNVIQQFIDAPRAVGHASGEGTPAVQLEYLQPGTYFASWDGRDQNGAPVSSGIYWVRLIVNGTQTTKRIYVAR